jgi:hypothetical protein
VSDQGTTDYIVWMNDQERIVSFHQVDGYHIKSFTCHDFFISFIQALQDRGYRFQ